MAVTKIHPIKSTLKKALDYIENPDKTDEKLFVSSYGCSYETADIEFQMLLDQAYQKGNNLAHHLIQAFEPGETTAEQAHEIGRHLADEVLQGKYTKLVLPVRAVETAGAAVLRRSGLAAVKVVCARPRLHELFKGPVAAGSKVHRRSPPFLFWAQKKRRPDLPKGEKRTPPFAVSYSIFDVSLFGWWASRESRSVSKLNPKVVNR